MKRTYRDTGLFHHAVRVGRNGKPIVITKFRTMKMDAEKEAGRVFGRGRFLGKFSKDDPRITRFGKFLRRTHLDEAPQIVNLLKGQFSLVGMRPLTRAEYSSLPPDVKKLYDEHGPAMIGVPYTLSNFPPTKEEVFEELKRFHSMHRENRLKANALYAFRFLKNRLTGKSWSK